MMIAYSLLSISILALLIFLTKATHRASDRPHGSWALALGFLLWLGMTGWLGASGLLADFSGMPPRFTVFLASISLGTIALAFSPLGTRLVKETPMMWLVGYQAFRIPVELMLHRLYLEGVVPVQMTYSGYNFDILSGASALVLWGLYRQQPAPNWLLWSWNLVSLSLLVTIVSIAVLSTPTSLRLFHNEPANTFVTGFPFIWLPAVLVTGALFGHVLVCRALLSERNVRHSAD